MDASSTKARPRLNHQASTSPVPSSAYGPHRRSPTSPSGSATSHASIAVAARIPAGTHAGRSALRSSGSSAGFKAIRPEADIAHPPALGALADVLGELPGIQGLGGPVLPLHARHDERFAVARAHRGELAALRQRDQLHADAAVGPLRDFIDWKEQQPRVGGQGCDKGHFFRNEYWRLRGRAVVHLPEVLALPRLAGEVAELAEEAQARGAVHQQ